MSTRKTTTFIGYTDGEAIGHGVANSMRLAHRQGCNALQITFLSSSSPNLPRTIDEHDADFVRKIRDFYIVVHGKYLYNFARPFSSGKWQVNKLTQELKLASKYNADVVIHQANNKPEFKLSEGKAYDNYVSNLIKVLDNTNELDNRILLENSCRQGSEMGYTLEQLASIYHRFPEPYLSRVGFCLDLCHVFVAGELDMRRSDKVKEYLQEFDILIGLHKLHLVHFNDSDKDFGARADRHASLGQGFIGSSSMDGFRAIVDCCKAHGIPMILETPRHSRLTDIEILKSFT